jgi:hypothetical protein
MNPHLSHQLAGERRRDLMTEADRARSAAPARRRARRAVLAAVLPTALAAAVLPSAAQAGTAFSLSDGSLLYSDSTPTGERNNVTMRSVNGKIVISDTTPLGTATSQCKVFNGDLECASHQSVRVILGTQDDRIEYRLPHAGTATSSPAALATTSSTAPRRTAPTTTTADPVATASFTSGAHSR